ncbi:MAG: dienelactone hydrolase family protein [Methylobacter sp.]|nr:dienelactone hydrolase family protein [Methylobacter sp.]MDP2099602.1 dienelactone hydrolase family protein [Methylobacter sp.]MDP2429798.1 dienelactone hydrolase family protein [Methylobacter sp.]MDP3055518.1 dienelactone hydrolase family protein [Methylobacter sp.]MDP3363392.1 dienelactone hydrolase family protein [Methylobacter sp.]
MAIISNTVVYMDGDTVLEAFFAFDDALTGQRPAVLINHAWGGRDDFVAEKAKKLAELGYVGFAVDMYGKGVLGASPEENMALMQPFMADRAMLQRRIKAALAAVKLMPWVDDSKIAAMGFCFGGLCVLDLARTGVDIKGVVSFHGLLLPPGNTQGNMIKAKVLALHGNDDPMVPPEQVLAFEREMTEAGADWQLHSYGNTMHAFTNPAANDPGFGTVYQPDADRRSWLAMQNFFAEIFS